MENDIVQKDDTTDHEGLEKFVSTNEFGDKQAVSMNERTV